MTRGVTRQAALLPLLPQVCLSVGDTYHWNGMKLEFNREEREALRIKIAEERQRQQARPMPNLAHLR